jgi:PAS domain S-box-containing protein
MSVVEGPAAPADPTAAPAPAVGTAARAASAAAPAAPATGGGGVRARARFLLRGESAVASIGIAAAAILLAAMASLSWWTMRTHRDQAGAWQSERINSVGTLLANSGEMMLAQNDLSGLRRTVTEVARMEGSLSISVLIPPDQVIADSDPSKISLQKLPEKWSAVLEPFDESESSGGGASGASMTRSFAMMVPGRGPAVLELSMPPARLADLAWDTQGQIGAIGAVSLAALLVAYRRLRLRLRAMGAVRDALMATAAGETAHAVLAVAPELGPEAPAWNALLAQIETVRKKAHVDQAKQALSSHRGPRSDLDAAFDAMSQGLILVDEQLKVRYANGAAGAFLQVKRDQLAGTEVSRWIAQDEVLACINGISDGSLRRKTTIEVEQKPPSGTAATVLRFTIRPVRREDSAAAMVMIEDITQQRVAAESRNSFVAQATHELRTPLTNIRLYVETAIEDGEKDPAVRGKCLNVINQETRRLERIVGEMLSIAEIEAGSLKIKRDDLRVDQLMSELKLDFEEQAAEKNLTFIFELPPKMPVVQADRDKIAVALHNLVGNALKYTMPGGSVTVKLDAEPHQLVFTISDSGIGIADEDQTKIFERFYRANDPRVEKITGTGLGLALAREVARLHGGEISVKSQLNKGSTFTFTLPTTSRAEAA